jgi:hypothetical protein
MWLKKLIEEEIKDVKEAQMLDIILQLEVTEDFSFEQRCYMELKCSQSSSQRLKRLKWKIWI